MWFLLDKDDPSKQKPKSIWGLISMRALVIAVVITLALHVVGYAVFRLVVQSTRSAPKEISVPTIMVPSPTPPGKQAS